MKILCVSGKNLPNTHRSEGLSIDFEAVLGELGNIFPNLAFYCQERKALVQCYISLHEIDSIGSV